MNEIKRLSNTKFQSGYWARLVDWFISPPASVKEVGARRRSQLLAAMTLVIGILNSVGVVFTPTEELRRIIPLILLSVLLFIAYGLSRTRFYYIGSWLVVVAISLAAYFLAAEPGSQSQSVLLTFLPLAFALGLGLLSQLELIILVVGTTVMTFLLPVLDPTLSGPDIVGAGGTLMTLGALLLIVNAVQLSVEKTRRQDLINANKELLALQGGLEQRVAERTSALSTVAEVSTAASTILETDKLLQEVVDLSKARFGFYHAHIYLLNESGDTLVLASGAGDVGRQMVAEGRSIPLDRERSLVARAAREKQGVTVNDVTQAPDFLPHPLLPDTRSELAVPMMVGEKVLGVFDVQSEVIGRFTEADIAVQTTLASQVASAIQNARSYTEVQRNQELLSDALEIARLANWEYDYEKDLFTFNDQFYSIFHTTAEKVGGYRISSADYARYFVHPDDQALVGIEIGKVINSKERNFTTDLEHRIIFADGGIGHIAVHIRVERDANGKIIRWYGANQDVTERRQAEELNRRRAEQQAALNTISQKIQNATTVEAALQVAARELGHALGKKPTLVTLEPSLLTKEKEFKNEY